LLGQLFSGIDLTRRSMNKIASDDYRKIADKTLACLWIEIFANQMAWYFLVSYASGSPDPVTIASYLCVLCVMMSA